MSLPGRRIVTEVKDIEIPLLPENIQNRIEQNVIDVKPEEVVAIADSKNDGIARKLENIKAYQFKTGVSGNPGGRPKVDAKVKALVKEKSLPAFLTLVELMENKETPPKTRCDAAMAILDRAYGKAVQPIDAQIGGPGGGAIQIAFVGVMKEWAE